MGLFDLITFPIKRKVAQMKFEQTQFEIAEKQLSEAVKIIDKSRIDTDEKQWELIGSGKKYLSEDDYKRVRENVFKFWKGNTHARGIVRSYVKFVIGRGIEVHAHDEAEIVQKTWDEFKRGSLKHQKQKEIVRRLLRDGEIFLRYFENAETGKLKFRFIDPDFIKDAENPDINTHGIKTNPDDIEDIISYYRVNSKGEHAEIILAKEIYHHKILCDSDEKRGRSILEVLLPTIKKYEGWLNDRIILNKVRTAVVLVKQMQGTPTQLASNVANREVTKSSTYAEFKQQTMRPGTVITASPGVEYKFTHPNIDARDVKDDGRAILLALVAGSGLAEYMVTGDASNQNYASTMISESPAVREFEDWQSECTEIFKDMFYRVIDAGILYGEIPEKSRHTEYFLNKKTGKEIQARVHTDTSRLCDVIFPSMIHRELDKETAAYLLHDQQGWASRDTISSKLGYNPMEERDKIRRSQSREEEDRGFEKQRTAAMGKGTEEPKEEQITEYKIVSVCPKCKMEIEHREGISSKTIECPRCKERMKRKKKES